MSIKNIKNHFEVNFHLFYKNKHKFKLIELIKHNQPNYKLHLIKSDNVIDKYSRKINLINTFMEPTPSNIIKFYRTADDYGCFSNFYKAPIEIDGLIYPTSEHYL